MAVYIIVVTNCCPREDRIESSESIRLVLPGLCASTLKIPMYLNVLLHPGRV